MVEHEFICPECDTVVQDTDTKKTHVCPLCDAEMYWNLQGIGIPQGDYRHESHSLAIHPSQIPEHKQLFPSVEVTSDGLPTFTSTKQQEKYAEACGFHKKRQRQKVRGKRIA